ncbi:transcription termination/antitermination protein NusA [Mesomycoplasma conjunctivae]|uniref:transcription termination/antitermination protein NusA n=1 Tax=Mesomycoplasma conjunctivae TaxID=45361 RepID=UPI003DA2CBE6
MNSNMKKKSKQVSSIEQKTTTKLILESLKEIAQQNQTTIDVVLETFSKSIEKVINKKIDPEAELELETDFDKFIFKVYNINGEIVEDTYFDNLDDLAKHEASFSFISISDATAKKIAKPEDLQVGNRVKIEIDITTFDKSIFQSAIQNFKQTNSEINRQRIYDKYLPLKNTVILAKITNKIHSGYIFELVEDKVAAFMPSHYSIGQKLKVGDILEVVIEDVNKSSKQSQIIVSSKSIQLVKNKIINAIPELQTNNLEIVSIARIPGEKCKVAVKKTNLPGSDHISELGAIIGEKGVRIESISQDLDGEQIEIVKYDENILTFVANAIAPARVVCVKEFKINNKNKHYTVVVPDFQHTLAIGKKGSNVQLATDLTRIKKLEIIPYSRALKDDKFEIEWNGNIADVEEMKSLRQNYTNKKESIRRQRNKNYNDNFSTILEEFEKDIQKYKEPYSFLDEDNIEIIHSNKTSKTPNSLDNLPNEQTQENDLNLDSQQQDNHIKQKVNFQNTSQDYRENQPLFDADSLINSALSESIKENALIDQAEVENEQQRDQKNDKRLNSSFKNEAQESKKIADKTKQQDNNEAKTPILNQKEARQIQREIQNFKSDNDLVDYSGVDEIEIDLDEFDF